MKADDPVGFPDAVLVQQLPTGLRCRIHGKDHWVPRAGILSAAGLAKPGDRATLVVTRQAAEALGLLGPGPD